MNNIVLLVVFILGIVLMQFVQAQSVEDIINKYLEARGGKDKLKAIKSIYMEGSREMMGTMMAVKVTVVNGKLFRKDFEFGGISGYTMVTPTEGWSLIPMQSEKAKTITANTLITMQEELDIAGPMTDYIPKGHKAELQGKEIVNGCQAYKINVRLRTGNEITYYIDKETYLLIQSRRISAAVNYELQEIVTDYRDYKLFDGIMFPQTISNPGSSIMAGSTTFNTIVLNKNIDESEYIPSC